MPIDSESYHTISASTRSLILENNDNDDDTSTVCSTVSADGNDTKPSQHVVSADERGSRVSVSFDLGANKVHEIETIQQQELWYSPNEFALMQQELLDTLHLFFAHGGHIAGICQRILGRVHRECCCAERENDPLLPVVRTKLNQVYENDDKCQAFDLVGAERLVVGHLLEEAEEQRMLILEMLQRRGQSCCPPNYNGTNDVDSRAHEAQRISLASRLFSQEIAAALSVALEQEDEDWDSDSDDELH